MKVILLLLFCRTHFAAIFEKAQSLPVGNIVYTGDEPSKLACIQKSMFYKADAIYDGQKCTCVKKDESGNPTVTQKEVKGDAYILVGDKNLKIKPAMKSCKSIAESDPSAPSGVYTVDYTPTQTIQVYCDMDKNLKTLNGDGGEIIEKGGWMLVANVSFSTTINGHGIYQIVSDISTDVKELKTAASSNFLFDLSQLSKFSIDFHEIRFYCKRERTVHLLAFQSVLDYFMGKTNTCVPSCNTFKRFADDNSVLGSSCERWNREKWGCSSQATDSERVYSFPFYIRGGGVHYTLDATKKRLECDDHLKGDPGKWQIFVR